MRNEDIVVSKVSNKLVLLGSATLLSMVSFEIRAFAAGFEILRPHRAIYEITLDKASDRSGIASMNGRIVYEMVGNECEGMTVRYRFVSNVNANGEIFRTDQQTSTHESADGKEFSFLTKSMVNDKLDREVRGIAENAKTGLVIDITSPEPRKMTLKNAKFLSTHLVEVIEKAKAGESFFTEQVFDAGDTADEVLKTTNIIGKQSIKSEALPGESKEVLDLLGSKQSWPVTMGYFGTVLEDSTEHIPEYEVSFLLYEGGISRKLEMRYPDYSLNGTLVGLTMLDQNECKIDN